MPFWRAHLSAPPVWPGVHQVYEIILARTVHSSKWHFSCSVTSNVWCMWGHAGKGRVSQVEVGPHCSWKYWNVLYSGDAEVATLILGLHMYHQVTAPPGSQPISDGVSWNGLPHVWKHQPFLEWFVFYLLARRDRKDLKENSFRESSNSLYLFPPPPRTAVFIYIMSLKGDAMGTF